MRVKFFNIKKAKRMYKMRNQFLVLIIALCTMRIHKKTKLNAHVPDACALLNLKKRIRLLNMRISGDIKGTVE